MSEENTTNDAAEEQTPGGTPGIKVPEGAQVPGVDMTQGITSKPEEAPATEAPEAPAPEAPQAPEQPQPEQPAANDATTTEAAPVVDPMKPVGPN